MAQIQRNQAASGLMPNAAGNFGADPITGAPITDKFAAQNLRLPSADTINTVGSYMARSAPQMLPGRPTRGGGGGGSMGPRRERQKIMRVGPRTTQEYAAENGGLSPQRTSSLDAAYAEGDFSQPRAMPTALPGSGGVTPMGMGDIAGGTAGSEVGQMFNDALPRPKPMAKGGTMKPDNVYTVGEKGPEMVVPTGDGNMHVIPHGATKKLLSMLPGRPTPLEEGGVMRSEAGQVGLLNSEYGTGYADNRSQSVPLPGLPSVMSDERGMIQPGALPGADTMPYMPDPVSGPWAARDGVMPGMDRAPLMRGIQAAQNVVRGSEIPLMPATDSELVPDGRTGEYVPLAMMKQRVADRAIDFNNELFDVRDRTDRNRVQQELAMRAERPALGTPTAPATGLPGLPAMRPSTMRAIDRNTERLMRSPEGAVLAMQQGQEANKIAQRMQAAATAVPVRDPNTGEVRGYVTGTGASLPNMTPTRRVQRTVEVDGTMYNVYDDNTSAPIAGLPTAAPKQQFIDQFTGRIVEFDANIDTSGLPENQFKPVMRKTTETGGAKEDPAKPAGTAQAPVKAATAAEWAKLPAGTQYLAPNGQIYTKK